MDPNLFLRTFWRMEFRPEIFVAMSFDPAYEDRFAQVIEPAITGINIGGKPLKPNRVDISGSGVSIISAILDGISHCQLFLADVSTVGKDAVSGHSYRNGNVMYEVGLAVACRQPQEVLLIRDDRDNFLFDVSIIPHLHLNFSDVVEARTKLQEALVARLDDRKYVYDARVQRAMESLSREEVKWLRAFAERTTNQIWGPRETGKIEFLHMEAIPRLLDKQIIKLVGTFEKGNAAYRWTELGYIVAQRVKNFTGFKPDLSLTLSENEGKEENNPE